MSSQEDANKKITHCKACDAEFNTFNRTVTGPHGPMVLEEDLCGKCRRTIILYDLETDEELEAREAAELLVLSHTGKRHEIQTE